MKNTNNLSHKDFSESLFWDIDTSTLDIEQHLKFIIGRVMEMGTMEDWQLLCRSFTLDRIIDVAKQIRTLSPKSLAFLSVIGNTPKESFRCYTSKPSTTTLWQY